MGQSVLSNACVQLSVTLIRSMCLSVHQSHLHLHNYLILSHHYLYVFNSDKNLLDLDSSDIEVMDRIPGCVIPAAYETAVSRLLYLPLGKLLAVPHKPSW